MASKGFYRTCVAIEGVLKRMKKDKRSFAPVPTIIILMIFPPNTFNIFYNYINKKYYPINYSYNQNNW